MSNCGWASSHLYIEADKPLLEKIESYMNTLSGEPYLESWDISYGGGHPRLYIGFSDGEMYSDFDKHMIDFCKNLEYKFGVKLSGYTEQQVDGDTYIVEYTGDSYNSISVSDVAKLGVTKLKELTEQH